IDQIFIRRIWTAVRIETLDLEVRLVCAEPGLGGVVETAPRGHGAVRGIDRIAVVGRDLDDVVIGLVASVVSRAIACLRPFAGIVETPVLAVDVQVIKISTLTLRAHVQLAVARELVAKKNAPRVTGETPRVILEGP